MKLYKLFALGVVALGLTACSDDKDINTASGVTVEMQNDEMSFAEDYTGTYMYIPVVLNGTANGEVKVNVQVSSFGETPATEGEDFLVTNTTIIIPEGQTEGGIEFYPVGDEIINASRQFSVTILSAEGASVGEKATTIVTLVDNESFLPDAYAAIQGIWTFEATTSRGKVSYTVLLEGAEEGEEGYLKNLTLYGWQGYDWVEVPVGFQFDATTMQSQLIFTYGTLVAEDVDFGDDLGICNVLLCTVDGNYLVSSGTAIAKAN